MMRPLSAPSSATTVCLRNLLGWLRLGWLEIPVKYISMY